VKRFEKHGSDLWRVLDYVYLDHPKIQPFFMKNKQKSPILYPKIYSDKSAIHVADANLFQLQMFLEI
jgi:hypothetical protein